MTKICHCKFVYAGGSVALAALAPQLALRASDGKEAVRPNILVILSDDHSAAHVGCYGNPDIATPNLDAFAAQGIRFTRAYATSPQSAPNRAAIMTGRGPIATDMTRFYVPLDAEFKTFPEDLRTSGYYTGVAGRCYHLDGGAEFMAEKPLEQYLIKSGKKTFPNRLDYVKECPHGMEDTEHIHAQFLDYMNSRDKNKPFFLQLSYSDPHRPYTAPKYHNPDSLNLFPQYPDTKGVREDLAAYYDEIHRLDTDFGYIMDYLAENGLEDNTIVVFMGDNGGAQFRGKGTLYEWGIMVPFMIRWPGVIPEGIVSGSVVSAEDLAPTLLEMAGAPIRKEITGISLVPLIKNPEQVVRKYAFSERGAHGSGLPGTSNNFDLQRCIVGPRYKLIYNAIPQIPHTPVDFAGNAFWKEIVSMNESGSLPEPLSNLYFSPERPLFELYDLQEDPFEFNNLYNDKKYKTIAKELMYELSVWMINERDFVPLPLR